MGADSIADRDIAGHRPARKPKADRQSAARADFTTTRPANRSCQPCLIGLEAVDQTKEEIQTIEASSTIVDKVRVGANEWRIVSQPMSGTRFQRSRR